MINRFDKNNSIQLNSEKLKNIYILINNLYSFFSKISIEFTYGHV